MADVIRQTVAPPTFAESRVAGVGAAQWGLVTRLQLLEAGVSAGGIAHWLKTRRLFRVHRGVFAFTGAPLCPEGRWMAAVLACGEGAALSHYAVAAAWSMLRYEEWRPVDVTILGRSRQAQEGIRPHRTRHLPASSLTVVRGIPATTVSRTLIDLADVAPDNHLYRAVDEADRRGLLNLRDLAEQARGAHGHHGLPRLRKLLDRHRPTGFSRSHLERRFLSLTDAVGLPRPLINKKIHNHEVDFQWPGHRLVVEVDGYEWHRTRRRFEDDRARDRTLTVAGWRVVRFTDRALNDEPQTVRAQLEQLIPR